MKENTVVAFQNPSDFQKDPLTEVLRAGARELLAQAVEAEVSVFLGSHAALVDAAGRRRVVRNGYLPERFIQTGIGPVSVRQPRVRDRGDGAIRFTSAILPRYLRRAKSLEDLLPWLYLKGISTGDFGEALAALLGSSAPGLSASTITRLKEVWGVEAERWQRRDLTAKRYVYFWVDGIYFSARMEEEKQCILVIVGATDKGQKELIAIADGYRESEQSWLEVLLDLKRRGLEMGPQLALGDGALGFWKALRQVYPGAREQRCWVHKTGNVLNKLPKGLQKKAKGRLQDIWMAETRKDAESAFDFFLEAYGPKYDNAVRLQLHALAYNLANFMRTLALPKEVEHWSLTTLREKLVKIGAKVVRHGRYVTFQLAEVAVPRSLFQKILSLIDDLRRRPVPA